MTLDKIFVRKFFVGQKRQSFSWMTKILSELFLYDKVDVSQDSEHASGVLKLFGLGSNRNARERLI